MSWIYLMAAIVTEVIGTTCMKFADGFTNLVPSVLIFVFYAISFVLMTIAMKTIDLGMTYAIWSGLGTALIFALGAVFFRETVTPLKLISIALILAGVIGLRLSSELH